MLLILMHLLAVLLRAGCLLLALQTTAAAPSPGSVQRPLRLCATESAPVPALLWQEAGLRPTADGGLDDFMVALVARSAKLNIVLKIAPSRRCPLGVQAGQYDGVLGLSATRERMAWASYPMSRDEPDESLRYQRIGYHLYMRRGGAWHWDGRRLHGAGRAQVGMITGYSGVPFLRERGLEVLETNAGPEGLLRMLAAERFALVCLPATEAALVLARDPALGQGLVRLDPPVVSRDYYLALARPLAERDPKLAALLWQTLTLERGSEWGLRARRAVEP